MTVANGNLVKIPIIDIDYQPGLPILPAGVCAGIVRRSLSVSIGTVTVGVGRMRTKYLRPTFLISWLLVSGAQLALAQSNPAGGSYLYQQGPPPAMPAVPYSISDYSGMMPPGYPPNAQAWPGTTLFDPAINQNYYENGLWFDRIINGKSKYFFTMEALITKTGAPPHTLVGATHVNDISAETANILGATSSSSSGTSSTTSTASSQFAQRFDATPKSDTDGTPNRSVSSSGSSSASASSSSGTSGSAAIPIFIQQDLGVLQQNFGSGGLRSSFGWWNPDGSGFMAQGYWQDVARSDFFLGDPWMDSSNTINNNVLSHIQPWFGLTLPGADRDNNGLNGVVVPYDLYVDFQFRSNLYGGNLDWYFAPIYERDYLKVRPVVGARYMMLNESFAFTGADSGLGYELSSSSAIGITGPNISSTGVTTSTTTTTTTTTGTGTTGGSGGGVTYYLTISSLDAQFSTFDPIQSYLMSRAQSQFAGPEAGFRFDFGSEETKLWLQSKFGLMANYNVRNVNGYNIGDHFNILSTDPVGASGSNENPVRAAGIKGTSFNNGTSTTTVSPMFEQGIFVQAPILKYVPVIKKMPVFEKAQFQAGYTILMLGNVYRASNDINWAQYPVLPTPGNGRALYYTTNWSLGVQWTF